MIKRIRLWVALCLLLPASAGAATIEADQYGAWSLRTAAAPQITKDYFCAAEGSFSNGYKMTLARNIIGQTSIIINWPGFTGTEGSIIPVRIAVDKKPLRDARAVLKGKDNLVIALGWDDAAIKELGTARRVRFTATGNDVTYGILDYDRAFTRLATCTASLVDRLPGIDALGSNISHRLHKAGLAHAKALKVPDNRNEEENFIVDHIFGGSSVSDEGGSDVMQRMLSYVDQLELLCRANFSSELGAPAPGGDWATADATCDSTNSGTATALAFEKDGGSVRVYYFEGSRAQADQVKTLRDLITKTFD